jgi:FtsZ-binding cell division protein ZapB
LGQLQLELNESHEQLKTQEQSSRVEQSKLQARVEQLQTDRTTVEEKIKALVEALALETKRREEG